MYADISTEFINKNMGVTLHVLLQCPPAGIDFGIQKCSGSKYETVQTQRSDGGDISFNFAIDLKSDLQKINAPRFTGPFAQGKPSDQFIYIDMGAYAGQTAGEWNGRIKIPLSGIGWNMIEQLASNTALILSTAIPGTAKNGGPIFATVKDFKGWKVDAAS